MFDLDKRKRMVNIADDEMQQARSWSERDRDYYDGYQYTDAEMQVLANRKQPALVINRIRRKVDAMVGIEQRGRVDPRAYGRNPQDEQAADIATKALRFVESTERLDVKRSSCFENLLVEGYGGVEVAAEERSGQIEVVVRRLRWEEIIFDPNSREKDFSDAAYLGILKWMTVDDAVNAGMAFWQGEPGELEAALIEAASDVTNASTGSFDDRPDGNSGIRWVDPRQKRIRMCQLYYKYRGVWQMSVFTGSLDIFNGASPYVGSDGKPVCPLILMTGYIDRKNRRYGLVRDMLSMQDEINKRRSKLLALVSQRQTMGVKGVVDVARLKRELAAPDGHVELDLQAVQEAAERGIKPFEVIQTSDMAAGQFQLLVEAKSEIDMLGPNASLAGQLTGAQSGRAIMAQQQAGLAELAPIYDSLRDWTERVYRSVWDRIRQFWTEPRWIRVTDDPQAAQFIGVNQMVMTPMGPQMVNPVGQIDVDIIVDQSPEYATLRAEQFDTLAKLAGQGYPIPPQIMLEASDLPEKAKLMESLKGDPQQSAMQQQMAMRGAVAEIEGKEASAERDRAAAAKDIASIGTMRAEAMATAAKAMQPPPMRVVGY